MRALKVSYSFVGEGGVAVNCHKPHFFLNTLYPFSVDSKVKDLNKMGFGNKEKKLSELKSNGKPFNLGV